MWSSILIFLHFFPIRHGPNLNQQKSEKVWDLWYHIGSITFHCPRFCFDRLILVNNSRCSRKHCICLHHRIGLLSTWYGVFMVPNDSHWWNCKIVPSYNNFAINASWVQEYIKVHTTVCWGVSPKNKYCKYFEIKLHQGIAISQPHYGDLCLKWKASSYYAL